MQRRIFLKSLLSVVAAGIGLNLKREALAPVPADKKILLQSSPVAGFQFYEGDLLWDALQTGDELRLVPEPDNPHDNRAVKVMWGKKQLGYVPRRDNAAVSQMLNRGQNLRAGIAGLKESDDPWERVTVDIYLLHNSKKGIG